VLKHHPDKKASSHVVPNSLYLAGVNQNTNDDAFFKCIQKAYEVLTNPEKRRQFDSVDPSVLEAEEEIPTAADFKVRSSHVTSMGPKTKSFHFPEQESRLFQDARSHLRDVLSILRQNTCPSPWRYQRQQAGSRRFLRLLVQL